ncbi:MAG TPA: gamma-glutamyltransferase [Patescibacteria group bacterium]|nr:gamma-glutamyltransferase [Patescibacteria group bacterium]
MPGVISAGDKHTAAAGAEMLKAGGNAVDAAVAAAFASFIAEIGVVHLGGSGVAQVFRPANGIDTYDCTTFDFFSTMPGLGSQPGPKDLDFERVTIDFGPTTQDFFLGRGSVAVPGNIAGLCTLAESFGQLPLTTILEPAIDLASNSHQLAPFQADTCELLKPIYTHTHEMRQIFAATGRIIGSGERLFVPDLAETLRSLAEQGAAYAYSGQLAQMILDDQKVQGGLLTREDLEAFRVRRNPPIRINYRNFEILLPPPSSSGGVLTAFSLKLLCHFNLENFTHGSADYLRLLFEVMAATTRARPKWDKASEELSEEEAINYFLSDSFVDNYKNEVLAGLMGPYTLPALSEPSPHPETSHISVIDGQGMAVSLTTTAGESAGYVVPGTGFIPNNILGEADLHPEGFHRRKAGSRIPTMMTPTVVLYNGKIRLVVGSGGSIRIRSAILQVLTNLLDFEMRLDNAVNVSRYHLESGVFQCELGYDPQAVDTLELLGYPVNRWDRRSIYFGGAHSVSRTPSGHLVAAGDNRRGGAKVVVK